MAPSLEERAESVQVIVETWGTPEKPFGVARRTKGSSPLGVEWRHQRKSPVSRACESGP